MLDNWRPIGGVMAICNAVMCDYSSSAKALIDVRTAAGKCHSGVKVYDKKCIIFNGEPRIVVLHISIFQ